MAISDDHRFKSKPAQNNYNLTGYYTNPTRLHSRGLISIFQPYIDTTLLINLLIINSTLFLQSNSPRYLNQEVIQIDFRGDI